MEHRKNQPGHLKRPDAFAFLIADHEKVRKMFRVFERLKEGKASEKAALVQAACTELSIHAQLEEEIFYPAARKVIDDEDLIDEALVEHASAKDLIVQLEMMDPDDKLYDAKFTVLGEYVAHHIKGEQEEMFPKLKQAKLDLVTLGEQLIQRKQELKADMGVLAPGEEDEREAKATAHRQKSARQ